MLLEKPWIMYESKEEIAKAIQQGLADRLEFPVGYSLEEDGFLFIIQLPGHQAHIRFTFEDLKSLYPHAAAFVDFIYSSWQESMNAATKEKRV